MIKHYFFHRATPDFIEAAGTDGLFEFGGHYWFYKLEVTYENDNTMLRIYDCIGRMVPLDLDAVSPLIGALMMVEGVTDSLGKVDTLIWMMSLTGQHDIAETLRANAEAAIQDLGFDEVDNKETIFYQDGTVLQSK